jgi:hypothetical protein
MSRGQQGRAPESATVHTTCRLPVALHERVLAEAALDGRRKSDMIVRLLTEACNFREHTRLMYAEGRPSQLSRDMLPGADEPGLVVGQPVNPLAKQVQRLMEPVLPADMSTTSNDTERHVVEASPAVERDMSQGIVRSGRARKEDCPAQAKHRTGVFCKTCGETP